MLTATPDETQTPSGGTLILGAGLLLSNIKGTSILPREDTVVASVVVTDTNGNTYNYKESLANGGRNWVNLKNTDVLFAGNNRLITSIELTSGSVNLNLL